MYIEREAVYEMLENAQFISDGEYCGYCTEDVTISDIPSSDVAPVVHGKFEPTNRIITRTSEIVFGYQCSVCNRFTRSQFMGSWNYCPNCGAKMDEN